MNERLTTKIDKHKAIISNLEVAPDTYEGIRK